MRYLKTYKIFESNDSIKEMVEDFLRDFSDEDFPVEIEIYQPDPLGRGSWGRVLILIGDEDNLSVNRLEKTSEDLPLYQNIDSFISLHEYLIGEGYHLETIACWIKPHNEPITAENPTMWVHQRPFSVRPTGHGIDEISNFISKIEEIEDWNEKNPPNLHKSFKLIDICYTKS